MQSFLRSYVSLILQLATLDHKRHTNIDIVNLAAPLAKSCSAETIRQSLSAKASINNSNNPGGFKITVFWKVSLLARLSYKILHNTAIVLTRFNDEIFKEEGEKVRNRYSCRFACAKFAWCTTYFVIDNSETNNRRSFIDQATCGHTYV